MQRFGHICFLSILLVLFGIREGYAQIVPDSSLNHPIPPVARQEADSINMIADTVKVTIKPRQPWEPKPKRAGLYSAIFPGGGQIYNRQYWKLPIVYGALGAGAYMIHYNLDNYQKFRRAYIYKTDGDASTFTPETLRYTDEQLKDIQNDYRKDADVAILLTAVGYALHIMDAVASAHLRNFDISRDISLQMKPILQNNGIGFGIAMNFK
ncbi:DUF5683 domain-containing protein [Polluticoccus soli]|uniref:DUF5683 domain-containing protein n=1 Tax=Polluticoccus soli TaxID=3034150 RepID=UPI0023E25CA4|nr:DUF5683 domain-containing protein [Flavipsychrobacter sp. JY13-12]